MQKLQALAILMGILATGVFAAPGPVPKHKGPDGFEYYDDSDIDIIRKDLLKRIEARGDPTNVQTIQAAVADLKKYHAEESYFKAAHRVQVAMENMLDVLEKQLAQVKKYHTGRGALNNAKENLPALDGVDRYSWDMIVDFLHGEKAKGESWVKGIDKAKENAEAHSKMIDENFKNNIESKKGKW